jgi:hypothetical protein
LELASFCYNLFSVTKEQHYQAFGWGIFLTTALIAAIWCLNESGLTGYLIRTGERLLHVRLVQISWLITIVVLCLPGYIIKRYFDGLAWKERLRAMPAPNIRESAKRSKYIKLDGVPPPAPTPVEVNALPKGQEEFIATCVACGHFFSARKTGTEIKCPQCGEIIPIGS